ncbi:uncharacterized protein LOC134816405 [Bolinopsis microptera]|uniref:uncharacterized protein LOC134816405 n=1 Tax=Bolinopsis microptera TaxID=2820187 RepID=UPI00307A4FA3
MCNHRLGTWLISGSGFQSLSQNLILPSIILLCVLYYVLHSINMMLTDCFASCTEGNMLHALREYSKKLLIVRPNARTRLEILRGLLEFMKRPDVIRELLTREFCDLLKAVWNYTRSDDGHTLTYVRNSGSLKFQLHVVCLRILDMVLEHDTVMFLSLNIIHTEELSRLLDLVDAKNKHVYCCLDNLTTTWSKQQTATAHQHLSGNTFGMLRKKISNKKTRYGELLEVVLTTEHGNMLVSELLFSHNICSVPHFRSYSPDSLHTDAILDTCRISQVISPQYVWIQFEEDWGTLDKIQQELNKPSFELMPLPSDYTDEDVIVRLSVTGFTFRARILEGSTALGGEPAEVLAIDFGWTCTVPKKDIYQKRRVLGKSHDYNIACLCKLADVIPTESNDKALILGSLKVLHRITQNLTFATAAFSNPAHQTLLLSLLYNSHDLDTARHVLYVLANAAADRQIGPRTPRPCHSARGPVYGVCRRDAPCYVVLHDCSGEELEGCSKVGRGPRDGPHYEDIQ